MVALMRTSRWPAETGFYCVGVNQLELFEHHYTATCLLRLVQIKVAVLETKVFMILGEHPENVKDIYLLWENTLS